MYLTPNGEEIPDFDPWEIINESKVLEAIRSMQEPEEEQKRIKTSEELLAKWRREPEFKEQNNYLLKLQADIDLRKSILSDWGKMNSERRAETSKIFRETAGVILEEEIAAFLGRMMRFNETSSQYESLVIEDLIRILKDKFEIKRQGDVPYVVMYTRLRLTDGKSDDTDLLMDDLEAISLGREYRESAKEELEPEKIIAAIEESKF